MGAHGQAFGGTRAERLPLRYAYEGRRGKNVALNSALALVLPATDSQLLVFSDDDATPAPDWLRQLERCARAHVLAGLAHVVRDFGVGPYVAQEKELSREKPRAALSTAIAVAWLLALLANGPLARFYREPRLRMVLQLLAINFLLIPRGSVTLPYVRRQMRFSAIFTINTAHGQTQLLCSIGLASLLTSLHFRPRELPWLPGWRGIRLVLAFGLASNSGVAAPDLIIGKILGMAEVGLCGKGMGLLNVFNQIITGAISPVICPLYVARPLICVMCSSSALYSMFSMPRYLLLAMGRVRTQAKLDAQAVPVWVAWAVVAGALFRNALSAEFTLAGRKMPATWFR